MAGDGSLAASPAVAKPEGSVPEGPTGAASSDTATAPAELSAAAAPVLTIFELAEKHKFPKILVESLLASLEADADTTVEDILSVPESTLQEVIRAMKKEPDEVQLVSPIAQGKVNVFLTKCRGPPKSVPAPSQAPVVTHAPVAVAPPPSMKRKMSDVLDQVDSETTYELLDPTSLGALRLAYIDVCGGPPPDSSLPSSEQMSALKTRLSSGTAPYVDFAVFGPFGKRFAKHRKFDAQVFVDNTLTNRLLHGPSDFAAWTGSWKVFAVAMTSLKAASPATLNLYYDGIRSLVEMFPNYWGVIFQADEKLRCERLDRALENHLMAGNSLEHSTWNILLREMAYGSPYATPSATHWWTVNVVLPCQSAAGMNLVTRLEGSQTMPDFQGTNSRPSGTQPIKKTLCSIWNNGGCAEICPYNDRHLCLTCGKGHRELDCHKALSKNNDGGKGQGGKNSRNKGGKGKGRSKY
jgi:hypothetical protein